MRTAHLRREIAAIRTEVIEVPRAAAAQVAQELRASGDFALVEEDGVARASTTVNDPLFPQQWGAKRINVQDAWDITNGASIVVAVLDSGVDASHPELAGRLLPGWDFVNDDADPADDTGHGTAIAGIIGANAHNGMGVAGIAPASTLLPVKVLDETNFGFFSDIAAGIVYAVDNGARVINLSLGSSSGSGILQTAIDYATAHDVVVVAAAGNDAHSVPEYPAACVGVIAVAATDAGNDPAWFSNYGSWITLAAPGVSIYTLFFSPEYVSVTGTSASAALVSGGFALLRSANPQLTAAAAVDRMTDSADDLAPNGWDPESGFGLLDLDAALASGSATSDRGRPAVTLVSPTKGNLVDGVFAVEVVASDNIGIARIDLHIDGEVYASTSVAPYVIAWDTEGLAAGMHTVRAYAYDAAGNHGRSSVVRVHVTPGAGLLVQSAKIDPGSGGPDGKLKLKAMVRLPGFDGTTDGISVSLEGSVGTVLAMEVPPGTMEMRRSAAKYRGLTLAPDGGDVRLVIKPNRVGGTHTLQISGRSLILNDTAEEIDLSIVVNGEVVSQPLILRPSRGDFVYP